MTDLPTRDDVDVQLSTTETRTLEIDEDQLAKILCEWAKDMGFSHRVEIDFCVSQDFLSGVVFKETVTR